MNFGHLRCLGTQNQIKYKFGTVYQLAFISAPGRVSDVSKITYERLCTLKHNMQVHVGYSLVPRPFPTFQFCDSIQN